MFAKTIIDSDAFLDMPLSAQALYFHLSMRADDDGFVNNPKKIQRVIGCNDDDFNVLVAKRFVLTFESGIIVIKHWKIHNYIRNDRKKDTSYPEEMALLEEKDNGAYTYRKDLIEIEDKSDISAVDMRKKAYEESSLPYSFDYKIRRAFWGKPCPICNASMSDYNDNGIVTETHRPTIQHNKPISKGGKHELGNISVICHKCNVSIQDNETDRLNADEVIEVWDSLSNDGQMSVKCQSNVSVGKDRLDKNSIGKNNNIGRFTPPTLEEVTEYCQERKNNVNPQKFIDFYESKGWMIGKNKMKDWKAAVRTWERHDNKASEKKPQYKQFSHSDNYSDLEKELLAN